MRTKEDAHDYRYFPEPDLVPIIIYDENINKIKDMLPEMPHKKVERFIKEYGLTEKEAQIIIEDKYLGEFYEKTVSLGSTPRSVANWILGDVLRLLNENDMESEKMIITPDMLNELINFIEEGKISITAGKKVFEEMFSTGKKAKDIIEEKGIVQISDTSEIEKMVDEVINNNPKSIEDFIAGKTQAAGFLMGQIMKLSKGKVNPKLAKEILDSKLEKFIK